ncbi:MAG: response regulator [Candidatus Odinarchaeota archaeon]
MGLKILVVDDDKTFLDKMNKILVRDKHSVEVAPSGEEALERMIRSSYDLILTDLMMGKMSGIELIKAMQKKRIKTPVIVITGYGTINSAVESIKHGAYDYLLKPFDLSDLRRKISEVKNEFQLRKKLSTPDIINITNLSEISDGLLMEYPNPFLIITSDGRPDEIANKYNLPLITAVNIDYSDDKDVIAPTKLHLLRDRIDEFVKTHKEGTIIFKGINELLKIHKWDHFYRFILYLKKEVISSDYSVLFLIRKGELAGNEVLYPLLHNTLSILSEQVFDDIIDIISHPIRKRIITLLKTLGPFNFNRIAEELQIDNSSILAFHIKRLVQKSILTKENNNYSLTARGEYFDDIIYALEKIGLSDPESRVKLFTLQE